MFCYCNSSPVLCVDRSGDRPIVGTSPSAETPEERDASFATANKQAQERAIANSFTYSFVYDDETFTVTGTVQFNSQYKAKEFIDSVYPLYRTAKVDRAFTIIGDLLPDVLEMLEKEIPEPLKTGIVLLDQGIAANDWVHNKIRAMSYAQIAALDTPYICVTVTVWPNGEVGCAFSKWK